MGHSVDRRSVREGFRRETRKTKGTRVLEQYVVAGCKKMETPSALASAAPICNDTINGGDQGHPRTPSQAEIWKLQIAPDHLLMLGLYVSDARLRRSCENSRGDL